MLARVRYTDHTSCASLPTWQGGRFFVSVFAKHAGVALWFFWTAAEDWLFQGFGFLESHSTIFCLLLLLVSPSYLSFILQVLYTNLSVMFSELLSTFLAFPRN